MTLTTKATSESRRSRGMRDRGLASSAFRGRARLRAAFLAAVWILPGIWCAAHLIAHDLESEHRELHAAMSAGDPVTGMSCDHAHGHSHPESPPVLSADGAKKLDTFALLTPTAKLGSSRATLQWHHHVVVSRSARRAAVMSGPRAPPLA